MDISLLDALGPIFLALASSIRAFQPSFHISTKSCNINLIREDNKTAGLFSITIFESLFVSFDSVEEEEEEEEDSTFVSLVVAVVAGLSTPLVINSMILDIVVRTFFLRFTSSYCSNFCPMVRNNLHKQTKDSSSRCSNNESKHILIILGFTKSFI